MTALLTEDISNLLRERLRRRNPHAPDEVRLHSENEDDPGNGAAGPDFRERGEMADERLKHHQVREERPLDQLTAPPGEALNRRALLQLRRKRIVEGAGVLRRDAHAEISNERHDREGR